jgi:pSer/pThr/pTyr-binding forkhead associated (FHA) protein
MVGRAHSTGADMFQLRNLESVTPLQLGELVLIGRGDACDVRLDDPSASRVHCRLLARDGKVFLTDVGSRWGTFVASRRVADCELRPGDEITIGETVLLLEATGTPAATTLARRSELRRPLLSSDQPVAWPTSPHLPMPRAETCESPPMVHPEEEDFERQDSERPAASLGAALPAEASPKPVLKSLPFPADEFRGGNASPTWARCWQDNVLPAVV